MFMFLKKNRTFILSFAGDSGGFFKPLFPFTGAYCFYRSEGNKLYILYSRKPENALFHGIVYLVAEIKFIYRCGRVHRCKYRNFKVWKKRYYLSAIVLLVEASREYYLIDKALYHRRHIPPPYRENEYKVASALYPVKIFFSFGINNLVADKALQIFIDHMTEDEYGLFVSSLEMRMNEYLEKTKESK